MIELPHPGGPNAKEGKEFKHLAFHDKDLVDNDYFEMTQLIYEFHFLSTPVKTIFNRKMDGEMLACLLQSFV